MGRDPLDGAIGGDALLKAALHQLGVVALVLHLCPSQGGGQCQGQAQVSGSDLAEGLGVGKRTREGRAKVKALRRKDPLGAKAMLRHNATGGRLAMTYSRVLTLTRTPPGQGC